MNPLPPLPLIDGCLFIDNSGWMESMNTCHRYLQYKSLNLRIPTAKKPSLNFGSVIHLALEYRYRNYRNRPVDQVYYETMAEMMTKFFEEHPVASDDWRNLNWAMTVLRKYNERYETEEFNLLTDEKGEPLVELSFAIPLFTWRGWISKEVTVSAKPVNYRNTDTAAELLYEIPIIYTGKIDLPISLDGGIWIMDHKTTSMLGDQHWNKMRMSSQQRGYVWSFETLTGKPASGYIVNTIRTKEPPKYVTDGSVKGKYTPATWWAESFQRERFYKQDLNEWKNNTIDLVEEFFWHYQRGYMPMKTEWCSSYGKCPYYEVCRMVPGDRDAILNSGGFFTDNKWSPLKQPTQTKQ